MIEIKNLTKFYGSHKAVDNLSFTVEPGKIYGFLGPNGAGKSTTMNIITGCLSATEGTVTIDGHDIFDDAYAAKKQIGYLPEQPPLYPDMTPEEYLNFVAEAKGIKNKLEREEEVHEAMLHTGILHVANRLIKNLSKGYKQRVGIAQAILGNPKVVILDEPTVGLDPLQIIEIRQLIRDLGKKHTVILSSHILTEVNSVCDEILIISHGKLVASDTAENLAKRAGNSHLLQLTVRGEQAMVEQILNGLPYSKTYKPSEEAGAVDVTIQMEEEDQGQETEDYRERVFFALADARCAILTMHQQKASLEEVFLELTEEGGSNS